MDTKAKTLHTQIVNEANSISNHQLADTKSVGKQFASQRVSEQLGRQLRDGCSGAHRGERREKGVWHKRLYN